jgi:putative salt-induced outer membrane protein YdiY
MGEIGDGSFYFSPCHLGLPILGGAFTTKRMRLIYYTLMVVSLTSLIHAEDAGWKHNGNFALSLTSGNSDTLNSTLGLDSIKKDGLYTYSNEFDAIYGEDDRVRSNNQITNELKLTRRFPNPRWYAGATTDFLYDPMANVDYRVGVYGLIGYHIIDTGKYKLRVEAGPGFVFENRNDLTDQHAAYKAAQYFDWQISKATRFFQSLKATGEMTDISNFIYTAELGVESALGGPWSIRLAAKAIHYGQTSNESRADDQLITIGLGYSFTPGGSDAASLGDVHKERKIIPGEWVTTALAGGAYASGNTDASSVALGILAKRKSDLTSSEIGLNGYYGESDGVRTAESANFTAHHQYSFSKPYFAGLRFDANYDAIADLDYRLSMTPYLGRFLYENGDAFVSVEVGSSAVTVRKGGVDDTYLAAYASLKAEKHFNDRTRLYGDVTWRGEAADTANYVLSSQLGLDHAISDSTKLKLLLANTYDNMSAPGRKANDLKLIAGFEFKL